jgi:hypothetical protein
MTDMAICPHCGCDHAESTYAENTPEYRVWKQAQNKGKAAASWVFDGNTTKPTFLQALKWISDGDPQMETLEPRSLRGDYTDEQLLADAGWVPHDGTDLRDDLIAQYDQDTVAAFWHEVEKIARDQTEPVTEPGKLNGVMEFDHVIRVKDGSRVAEPEGIHAPELYMSTADDGQILDEHERDYREQAERQGWQLLTGWTGQHGYRGLVMHPSEYVGGNLAEHILGRPGDYVAVTVETDDGQGLAGWAIAYREADAS